MTARFSRRRFLAASSLASAAAWWPAELRASRSPHVYIPSGHAGDPDRQALAARAIEAAKAAGADYADVRLTLTHNHYYNDGYPGPVSLTRGVGVRAYVDGYMGFMGSAVWTADEMGRLGRGAVAQARANGVGRRKPLDLGIVPPVVNGEWIMPVKYDPFEVPVAEIMDFWEDLSDYAESFAPAAMNLNNFKTGMSYIRQSKTFASTEGSSWFQQTYTTRGGITVIHRGQYHLALQYGSAESDAMSPAGKGWELICDANLKGAIPRLLVEAEQARHVVPIEVGRYEAVLSARAMSALVDQTLGAATELDAAMSYEANAAGGSYLDEPLDMLGHEQVASPAVTITANRSLPGGAATVRWDDDGVTPEDFTIVKDGVLVDYQTSREQAGWLAPYYQRLNRPIRSHGCANAQSALFTPMQHAPNLKLEPGPASLNFNELVARTDKGVAVLDMSLVMDQQSLSGVAYYPVMREIVKGRLGAYIGNAALTFRAPDLWKTLDALGGPDSLRWFGYERGKGQPRQLTVHSVGAVPGKFTQLSVVDAIRRV